MDLLFPVHEIPSVEYAIVWLEPEPTATQRLFPYAIPRTLLNIELPFVPQYQLIPSNE